MSSVIFPPNFFKTVPGHAFSGLVAGCMCVGMAGILSNPKYALIEKAAVMLAPLLMLSYGWFVARRGARFVWPYGAGLLVGCALGAFAAGAWEPGRPGIHVTPAMITLAAVCGAWWVTLVIFRGRIVRRGVKPTRPCEICSAPITKGRMCETCAAARLGPTAGDTPRR